MGQEEYRESRERMVESQLVARGIRDSRVLEAMRRVPRHRFVPEKSAVEAYDDRPLSIGHEQTISQPFMVALMTEALELAGGERVLELGTGSGYQAAILAELAKKVYTIERVGPLLERAREILEQLGYTNISFKADDGTLGWREHAPYDAVIVTAGSPGVPEPLLAQTADGGRLVIPVGSMYGQDLLKLIKGDGEIRQENLGACRFVGLVGAHGWGA